MTNEVPTTWLGVGIGQAIDYSGRLEIVTCIHPNRPVLVVGYIGGADPSVGIMSDYIDDYDVFDLKDKTPVDYEAMLETDHERVENLLEARYASLSALEGQKENEWYARMERKHPGYDSFDLGV